MAVMTEISYPRPSWLTCLVDCKKEVKEDQEVIQAGCGHIVCSAECLDTLKRKSTLPNTGVIELKCPSCHLPLDASMESNKIIVKDAFPFKPYAENVSLICDVCVYNNPAVSYCANCPSYLCSNCDPYHKVGRQTHTHQVTNDLEERKAVEFVRLTHERSICKCHTDDSEISMAVTHNCKHCKKGICVLCAPEHRQQQHGVVNVNARRLRLINRIKEAKQLLEKVEDVELKLIKKKKEELPGAWYKIHAEVNTEFAAFIEKCVKQCFARKDEMPPRFKEACKAINTKLDGLQGNDLMIQRYLEVARSVKDDGDDQSILQLTSRIAPLGAKIDKVNDDLKDYEDFTMRNHCFQLSRSWNQDTAVFMNEFAEVIHGHPKDYPPFSLDLNGSTGTSARLADNREVGNSVEIFKSVLSRMEKEMKDNETKTKADEEPEKKAEEAKIVGEEEAKKRQVVNKQRAVDSNTHTKKQQIESKVSTSPDLPTRPCSPSMPKLTPQAARRVGRPRKRPQK